MDRGQYVSGTKPESQLYEKFDQSVIECYHCSDSFFTRFNNSYNTIGGPSSNPMKVATTNVTNIMSNKI